MAHKLDNVVDLIASPHGLAVVASVASVVLLARSVLAFEPPRPISIAPSIDELAPGPFVDRLRAKYPKDIYPNGHNFLTPWGKVCFFDYITRRRARLNFL